MYVCIYFSFYVRLCQLPAATCLNAPLPSYCIRLGPRSLSQPYMLNTAERRIRLGILFIFSLFGEYNNLEYVHIHDICRVNQAENIIRILVAVPQEYVNTYSTRRIPAPYRIPNPNPISSPAPPSVSGWECSRCARCFSLFPSSEYLYIIPINLSICVCIYICVYRYIDRYDDDKYTPERHLPTPGQREHSPQRHTAAGTAAHTTTDTGNRVSQRVNTTQTAYAHFRKRAQI